MVKPDLDPGFEPNPLKRFMGLPGGITEKVALQRATDSLEIIRVSAMNEIDTCLAKIAAFVEAKPTPSDAEQHELHKMGNSLLSLAGMFGMPDLGSAAYSLCELVDALNSRGVWDNEAIAIHYDAMRKLRDPSSVPPEERERLVAGLRKVTQRIGGGQRTNAAHA